MVAVCNTPTEPGSGEPRRRLLQLLFRESPPTGHVPVGRIMSDMKASSLATKRPSGQRLKTAIVRSVASSTAIETGQRIDTLERALRTGNSKYRHVKLAR